MAEKPRFTAPKREIPSFTACLATITTVPTVTVYNHIDVQPASKETEPWDTEPFVFTQKGDTYYGRGTTDDKGPALSALFGARAAIEANVPVNIRFLWEFEEEIGSPNFEKIITKAAPSLKTDSVVVSDTVWVSRNRPANSAGLRGLLGFILTLETGTVDTHSGETGGASRNPIAELMQLICDIYDPRTGKIKIKGFYDDVIPPTKKGAARLGKQRVHDQGVQESASPEEDAHRRSARSDEANLGHADARDSRRRRRISGAGFEIDCSAARGVKARAVWCRCRIREDQKLIAAAIKEKNPTCRFTLNRGAGVSNSARRTIAAGVEASGQVRVWSRCGFRARWRDDRRDDEYREGFEVSGAVPRLVAAGARLSRAE